MSKQIDLRGTPCPINFVSCKLEIERLTVNDNLQVDLDRGEPEIMVLSGLKDEGHKIEISGISSWKLPKVKYMDCFLQGAKINEDFSNWEWPENKIPTHYDFVRNIVKDYWPPQFRKDYGRLKPDIKFKVNPSYNKDTQKLTFTILNELFELYHIQEFYTYLFATTLCTIHIYNLKYCRCVDDDCCVHSTKKNS